MAVDPSGNIWVADWHTTRCSSSTPNTNTSGSSAKKAPAKGQFKGIGGIASDASGDIYVTDSGNNRVEEFSPLGAFLRQFGSAGLGRRPVL